jgi:hypothetical protein
MRWSLQESHRPCLSISLVFMMLMEVCFHKPSSRPKCLHTDMYIKISLTFWMASMENKRGRQTGSGICSSCTAQRKDTWPATSPEETSTYCRDVHKKWSVLRPPSLTHSPFHLLPLTTFRLHLAIHGIVLAKAFIITMKPQIRVLTDGKNSILIG